MVMPQRTEGRSLHFLDLEAAPHDHLPRKYRALERMGYTHSPASDFADIGPRKITRPERDTLTVMGEVAIIELTKH